MKNFIAEQLQLHPGIKPQDVIKMCFQAAYGAEHLLTDLEKVRGYLSDEFARTEASDGLLTELIAPEVCRVNIAVWKKLQLPMEWLFTLFVESAKVQMNDDFRGYLNDWLEYAQNGHTTAFSYTELTDTIEKYHNMCGEKPQAVHHSQFYRDNEKPAYRVISGPYVRLLPILEALSNKGGGIIAIEGRAASGKTTIAAALATALNAEVIHMDDFFLPKELRTEERLAEIGGNIHYERFAKEVLPNLNHSFEYRKFDCRTMTYSGTKQVTNAHWYIVEGSYSHHPKFGDYATIKVLTTVDPQTQMERIQHRNGPQMAQRFKEEWIPMEEKYLNTLNLSKNIITV